MCYTNEKPVASCTTFHQLQTKLYDQDGKFEWFDNGEEHRYYQIVTKINSFPEKYRSNFRILQVTVTTEVIA